MNRLAQGASIAATIVLMLGVGTLEAQTTIGGVTYVRSGLEQSVTASFMTADAVVTEGLYSGLVELSVSGTGESAATALNDAFWIFTWPTHEPRDPVYNPSFYQLNVDTQTLLGWLDPGWSGAQLAVQKIVYDLDAATEVTPPYLPAYRSDHTYNIVVDLGTDVPSQVHFGVADGGFGDNSGEYQITVYQLIPEIAVEIDIKPGSYPNSINLDSQGVISVAILSSSAFDATQVDANTVELAGANVAVRGKSDRLLASVEDVNGDDLDDLVLKVETVNLDPGTFQEGYAGLTGQIFGGGEAIIGFDEITIVPPQ